MPHVAIKGTRFYYQQAGRGADVVLLHAVTSNLAVWVFINLIETLAAEFRVTAYDLRGHGGSDVTPTGYTSRDMAADFKDLHAALDLGPALLVGHSFGAVVAVHAAVLYPDLVRGLVLSDPYFPGLREIEPHLGQSNVWQELKDALDKAGAPVGEECDFTRLFKTVAELRPEQIEVLKTEMGPPALRWLSQLPRLAPTSCGADVFAEAGLTAEKICSLPQPVVALYDEFTPFKATQAYLQTQARRWTMEMVPGAKHVAPLQNPTMFVHLVQRYLRVLAGNSVDGK